MRIIAVVGIRSQYIKICSIQRALKTRKRTNLEVIYIDAGQHYDDMLANYFIDELGITFDERIRYDTADSMKIFSEMIYRLIHTFQKYTSENPVDYVMCFGDANTTLATAIAASKSQIPLVHIEGGVRSGSFKGPEEANRIVSDHLSSLIFASSKTDMRNLQLENLAEKSYFVGDIIQDLVLSLRKQNFLSSPVIYHDGKSKHTYLQKNFVLASIHRKENAEKETLISLFRVLDKLPHDVLFILHPTLAQIVDKIDFDRNKITIAKHIPYYSMLAGINRCRYLITDSGALQREAYYLSKHCLVRQDVPFWQHLVEIGAHFIIGMEYESIHQGVERVEAALTCPYPETDFLGNGDSVNQIFDILMGESYVRDVI